MTTLSHGVKEGLVESPLEWPGVHAAKALVHGEPLEGFWFNRSKEWAARNRGLDVGYYDFATNYQVHLSPLPGFRDHLSPDEYCQMVADLISEIEEEGRRERDGDPVAGVEAILRQDPLEVPTRRPKRSARPVFHFHSQEARESLWGELKAFIEEYRSAADALQAGEMDAIHRFPEGSYRPQLPFLGCRHCRVRRRRRRGLWRSRSPRRSSGWSVGDRFRW